MKMINTPNTRGEYQKNIHDLSLSIYIVVVVLITLADVKNDPTACL